MKITLSKALKLKNKKVKLLSDIMKKLLANNSYNAESIPNYKSGELLITYLHEMNSLIVLKTEINRLNQGISEKMLRMAELKGLLSHLEYLNTECGTRTSIRGIDTREVVTIAAIDELEKDKQIEGFRTIIENLQDDIDTYNATTMLEAH